MGKAGESSVRTVAIADRLKAIIQEFSGYPADELSEHSSFLELGFDSLFLTQLSTAFQNEFQVKVTFRQLFGELQSIAALTAHLDRELPADRFAPSSPSVESPPEGPVSRPEPAPPVPVSTPADAGTRPAAAVIPATWPLASGPLSGSRVDLARAVFAQQLELMSQQLALLQRAATSSAPVEIPPAAVEASRLSSGAAATSGTTETNAVGTAPESPDVDAESVAVARGTTDSGFGLGARTRTGPDLTPRQRRHLDALIARYTEKTAESRRMAQHYRRWHADPRTAAGFNPLWKDMVYPLVVNRSSGSRLWDVDGNEYIDILNSFGPNFLGHSPPFITEALKAQLDRGIELGPQTPLAGETAQLFCEMTGMDRVSFVNTGSEAVQSAIRLSRTYTGRDRIVVFRKDYHGNFDEVLIRGVGPGGQPRTLPAAPGIPRRAVQDITALEYGSDEALSWIREHASEIAAVIVEPVQSRMPELQPREFLHELRRVTEDTGIVLVFDEVITGFRMGPRGAQGFYGVDADIATYGKVLGGGMPIGAVAGRSRFMDTFDGGMWRYGDDSFPEAGVTFFAGTFVRHPLAIAAANASLKYLAASGPALQESVTLRTTRLAGAVSELFRSNGIGIEMPHCGSQMFIRVNEQSDLATLLFYHLRDRGVHLLEGFASYLTASHTDEDVEALIERFTSSVEEMREGGVFGDAPLSVATETAETAGGFPLTSPQRELWIAAQFGDEASCAFNESDTLDLRGPLDFDALRSAVDAVLRRHKSLSTVFDVDGTTQYVRDDLAIDLEVIDLSQNLASERERLTDAVFRRNALTPFDLVNGPLVRTILIRLAPEHHLFVLYAHHIVFDGWSAGVVMRELADLYSAAVEGRRADLAPPADFRSYVEAQDRFERSAEGEEALDYWRGVYSTRPSRLDLPTDRPRPAQRTYAGSTVHVELSSDTSTAIKEAARGVGVTTHSLLLAAFQVLMARLSGQADFVIGVPAAGQVAHGLERLVGSCVNFMPFRSLYSEGTSFAEVARSTREAVLDAFENQRADLGRLTREVALERDPSRLPLIEIVFNHSTYLRQLDFARLETRARENTRGVVLHDLFMHIVEGDGRLVVDWDYNTDLFDETTIRRWIDHYEVLLRAIATNPTLPVESIPFFGADEGDGPLARYTGVEDAALVAGSFLGWVTDRVESAPNAVAVEDEAGRSWTYGELWAYADRVADGLAAGGVARGDLVGVMLERGAPMLGVLLGVLRHGAAYLPLDPDFPAERLAYMVEDGGVALVVTDQPGAAFGAARLVSPESLVAAGTAHGPGAPRALPGTDDLAYVIYTSGSTGKPKGVEITHGALRNFLGSMRESPGLSETDSLLAVTTLSFDISGLELFLPLCVGARVLVPSREVVSDGFALAGRLRESGATVMQATPATWRMLLDSGWKGGLKKILCGGEALPEELARSLVPRADEVWNLYGPTETTIWSTLERVTGEGPVLVGRPIANTRVYVLDRHEQLVPDGVHGEIWIAGGGVARGYRNRPELTEERFRADPFVAGERMYRTGDLGRWRSDGRLEHLGRMDFQVKVHGYRIELGEIESALESLAEVKQAVVMARGEAEDKRLVAYVIFDAGRELLASEIRTRLGETLPRYMVPGIVVALESFPLTPNGKVDRKALPDPLESGLAVAHREYEAPEGPLEELLAGIWREVLKVERVGRHDNFFELGGHSLLAVQAAALLAKRSGATLNARELVFRDLNQLAALATNMSAKPVPVLLAGVHGGSPGEEAEAEELGWAARIGRSIQRRI